MPKIALNVQKGTMAWNPPPSSATSAQEERLEMPRLWKILPTASHVLLADIPT
jgi:hypothetical protein